MVRLCIQGIQGKPLQKVDIHTATLHGAKEGWVTVLRGSSCLHMCWISPDQVSHQCSNYITKNHSHSYHPSTACVLKPNCWAIKSCVSLSWHRSYRLCIIYGTVSGLKGKSPLTKEHKPWLSSPLDTFQHLPSAKGSLICAGRLGEKWTRQLIPLKKDSWIGGLVTCTTNNTM